VAFITVNPQIVDVAGSAKDVSSHIFPRIAVGMLWIAAVFDPIGSFYVRYVALILAICCFVFYGGLTSFVLAKNTLQLVYVRYTAILLPLWGSLLYIFRSGYDSEFIDTSYFAGAILSLFSLIYRGQGLVSFSLASMMVVLRALALVIIFAQFSIIFDFGIEWISFFTENNVSLLGERSYAGFTFPYIYFLASPILVFLCAYDIESFLSQPSVISFMLMALSLFALVLTGTRAHILISLIFIPFYWFAIFSRRKGMWVVLLLLALVLFLSISGSPLLESFFSLKEESNAIKASFLARYSELFNDFWSFVFGQGFNAHAWSSVFRSMIVFDIGASKTELTYLELVRAFGIVVGGGYVVLLIAIVVKTRDLSREHRWIFPAVTLFLVDSAVNPYLFSTNGILPLGLILGVVSLYNSKAKTRLLTGMRPL
jgi:hypothetical protein